MECNHKWVRPGYGNDLLCIKCGYASMQATMTMPVTEPIQQPILREKMEVPLCTGDKTVKVSVYKDELIKELQRSLGLDIAHNIMQGGA